MTKPRAPLSIEDALTRAIGNLTVARAAEVTGRRPSYLYACADPDKADQHLTALDLVKLDAAHLEFDGTAPIYAAIGAILTAHHADHFTGAIALRTHALAMIKEGSEAEIALLDAADDPHDRRRLSDGLRQLQEAHEASGHAMAAVQQLLAAPARAPP